MPRPFTCSHMADWAFVSAAALSGYIRFNSDSTVTSHGPTLSPVFLVTPYASRRKDGTSRLFTLQRAVYVLLPFGRLHSREEIRLLILRPVGRISRQTLPYSPHIDP